MRYYIDFDRTLFDTDSFLAYMRDRYDLSAVSGLDADAFGEQLALRADAGTLPVAPGELAQFLYPDAATFVREKENAATIITYGNAALQEIKAKSALHGIPRTAVMYTGDQRKGDYLAPHAHLHQGAIAVDDTVEELEGYARACPPLMLYEMRRDGGSGNGRWPVIRSLAELP